ncbi:MAG: FAD-binding domain-containing protein [Candidatus Nanohaloarchaea archaeon]
MNIVFHRRDLRTQDNKALEAAGEKAAPIYIFDPEEWNHELSLDARKEFVLESLKDLNRQYIRLGTELTLFYREPVDILTRLKSDNHKVIFNKDANHFFQEKERKLREKFTPVNGNTVISRKSGRPEKWANNAKYWFESKQYERPESLNENNLDGNTSLDEIRERYSISPGKEGFGKGGSFEAEKRLEKFIENIDDYSGCISSPSKAESSTSHLSPYIRYGCISPRQVYQRVKEETDSRNNQRSIEMFLDRVFWQQHFNQKIEDNPELFEKAINPVYEEPHREKRNEEKIKAWKKGKTGYPLVDASMRALVETGWLNFRMRAMCASFYSYILKQWWKEGADFFYKHLIDADVAINYYQWQMQSGLIGVHANRVYNPTKQVRDNDPEGEFIRKYVSELESVPDEFIDEPWNMPERIQKKCGVIIGKDYPEPIVNYEREARKAREFFNSKASKAYASFRDDEVWRKASLSSRHDREEILEKADDSQKDLKDFQS